MNKVDSNGTRNDNYQNALRVATPNISTLLWAVRSEGGDGG